MDQPEALFEHTQVESCRKAAIAQAVAAVGEVLSKVLLCHLNCQA